MKYAAAFILFFASLAQAGTITVMPGDDARAKINTAQAGDTITVVGNFNVSGQITLKSNQDIAGIGASKITSTTGTDQFAWLMPNNLTGLRVHSLAFEANAGVFGAQGFISKTAITKCDFKFGANNTGYSSFAIRAVGGSDGLSFDDNNLHDSENSDRDADINGAKNFSYQRNKFHNTNYGIHLDGANVNCDLNDNVGDGYSVMAMEVQDNGGVGGNGIRILRNTYRNWRKINNWSMGLSVDPQRTANVEVAYNYLDTGNGKIEVGSHLAYAIEGGFQSGSIHDNICAGQWVTDICVSMAVHLKNNKSFGNYTSFKDSTGKTYVGQWWGAYTDEGGLVGQGRVIDDGGNTWTQDYTKLPAPGNPTTQPVDPAPYSFAISNVVAHEATVTFTDTPANATLAVKFTSDPAAGTVYDLGTVSLPAGTKIATLAKFPNNWKMAGYPIVNGVAGAAFKFQTQRQDPMDWPNYPKPELKTVIQPPPLADYVLTFNFKAGVTSFTATGASDPITSVVVTHKSGKSETAQAVQP